jgi:uncharacterized membrane protein YfcA
VLDPALTWNALAVIWAGAFIGAFAVGGAGFAFALAASAVWLHVLDPLRTTALVLACGVILHIGFIWKVRKHIDAGRLWPFLLGGAIGIPIGIRILTRTDVGVLRAALGVMLVLYGFYALLMPRLPSVRYGGRVADGLVGFVGGILGGIGGYSGVLPTIWTQLRGWPKETARGVYQPFILAAQIFTLVLLGVVALDRTSLLLLLIVLPPLGLGAWVGWKVFDRLDDRRFRQLLGAMLILSGATLAF